MDLNELVASARSRAGCWTTRLTGQPAVFMERVDEEIRAGSEFSPGRVLEILNSLGAEDLPRYSTVKHHLGKNCSCWR